VHIDLDCRVLFRLRSWFRTESVGDLGSGDGVDIDFSCGHGDRWTVLVQGFVGLSSRCLVVVMVETEMLVGIEVVLLFVQFSPSYWLRIHGGDQGHRRSDAPKRANANGPQSRCRSLDFRGQVTFPHTRSSSRS
jgi:hypothetical protein